MVYWLGTIALVFLATLLINFIVGFLVLRIRARTYWVMSAVTSLVFTWIFTAIL